MNIPIALARAVSVNVKAARIQAGLSQKGLAEKTGLSAAYISRMERNPQNMTISTLGVLAEVLGVSPMFLVRLADTEKLSGQNIEALRECQKLLSSVLRDVS
jgi:transcriptional regulator with XRE-family HTH domain